MDGRSPHLFVALALGVACLAVIAGVGVADVASEGDSNADVVESSAASPDVQKTLLSTQSFPAPAANEVTREEYVETGLDVASAVSSDAEQLRGEFRQESFSSKFERLPASERQAYLDETTAGIELRIATLDQEHAALLTAYSEDEISTDRLLREYARLIERLDQERELVSVVETIAATSDDAVLSADTESYFNTLGAEILAMPTPVLDEYRTTVRGSTAEQIVYAQGAPEGLVMASVSDEQYARQATMRNERDVGGTDQFALGDEPRIVEAFERADDLYSGYRISIGAPFPQTSVYRVDTPQSQTNLVSFIDGATTNVFHEMRTVSPELVTMNDTHSSIMNGLELEVHTSEPSGPIHVSVVEAGTGEPVDATVRINDWTVGTTGDDGTLWTIQPLEEFELTAATGEDEFVTLTAP